MADDPISDIFRRQGVDFEFMTNLLGMVCYKCFVCGDVVDDSLVQDHARMKHNALFISIINVPIAEVDIEEKEENNDDEAAEV